MLLWVIKRSVCDHSSPICPHNFSFHTLSLYFLCDKSYHSSHLRTNYINFSSISEDNQAGLIASKHSKRSGDDVITAHMIRIEHVGVASNILAWVRRRNGTEGDVPVSVNISVSLHMRKVYWTVTFCDGTETWRIAWIGPKSCYWTRWQVACREATCNPRLSVITKLRQWGPLGLSRHDGGGKGRKKQVREISSSWDKV